MSRNRIIYQSKALFIAPSATGAQIALTGCNSAADVKKTGSPYKGETPTAIQNSTGLMVKLDRVQNLNFGFTINAQDVNEMGRLARINRISNEPPTVNLDYSYYVTDGLTERLMGFVFGGTDGGTRTGAHPFDTDMPIGAGALSGFLEETQGQNYYIITTNEGEDVVGASLSSEDSVVSVGNGFLSNYELNLTVGELPTANVTVEGFNIKCDTSGEDNGMSGISPGINTLADPNVAFGGSDLNRFYAIQDSLISATAGTGYNDIAALRPGDITVSTDDFSASDDEFITVASNKSTTAHIQSLSFSLPLARTTLSRLGAFFGYNRVIDVPLNMEVSLSVFATEFNANKNLFNVLCGSQPERTFSVLLNKCNDDGSHTPAIKYQFKGAILLSENHSLDIGGNETVDLTYSIQIGGANDTTRGLFMSGSYSAAEGSAGHNQSLDEQYPRLGTDGSGLSGLIKNFYGPGVRRNY
tara:strand:+ start:1050 stop:2459 length:1410 start_codon:yes stop_codon:yes gene_type:complete